MSAVSSLMDKLFRAMPDSYLDRSNDARVVQVAGCLGRRMKDD